MTFKVNAGTGHLWIVIDDQGYNEIIFRDNCELWETTIFDGTIQQRYTCPEEGTDTPVSINNNPNTIDVCVD